MYSEDYSQALVACLSFLNILLMCTSENKFFLSKIHNIGLRQLSQGPQGHLLSSIMTQMVDA